MKRFLHMLTERKNLCWEPAFEYLWVVFYRFQNLRFLTSAESLVFDANRQKQPIFGRYFIVRTF